MQKHIAIRQLYKKWYLYLILVGLVAIGVVATLYIQSVNRPLTTNQTKTVIARSDPIYITYIAIKGETSLAQLKETTPNVQTKMTEYGEYVNSIGSLVGGTNSKYWSFYIDGKMAGVGAGSYVQKGGEKIEWKFQN